ncbi:MAG TPA: FGGY-family carbohydrate kinase [Geminicoccus sp.]|jgi:erythritol kinase|uniref:FGGY-family carbohydrate kinase n=1 Tax=Geminicoccus sp. TaxID=2024832 RepID=UPI002E310A56|nr:FGGY-family carbohydrate kinase [Geminicoccus sp.]HEX2528945.1 FGGY-family carbohydrate kinase [Geminicoccus sp.]
MKPDLILGIDAGTSVTKVVAFDLQGRQVAAAAKPNRYVNLPGGGCEQDVVQTWLDCAEVLRDLGTKVPDLADRVLTVGVTAQGDGTWLIDKEGEPVTPAWLWLDSRAAGVVEAAERDGTTARTYPITGCGMNACQQSAHLMWMKRHAPEILQRAATGMHCKDWLYFKLTGIRATDVSEGVFTFGDFRRRDYSHEVLEAYELGDFSRLLPPILNGAEANHPLTAEAAAQVGLKPGTPISLGFVDVVCTAMGAGVYERGRRLGVSIIGSTGMHIRLAGSADEVTLGPVPSGYTMCLPVPGAYTQAQSNMAATLNIDWAVDLACQAAGALGHQVSRRDALPMLDARVLDARPGAAIWHPYIHTAGERGPFVDANARAMASGLDQNVQFLDLLRSVYEGLSFAARDCYSAIGHVPEEIRLAGGAARSRTLRTILASVLGAPVRAGTRGEEGATGTAMMAACAVGVFSSMDEAVTAWVTPSLGEPTYPDPELAKLYANLFPIYQSIHQRMRDVWRDLAKVRS